MDYLDYLAANLYEVVLVLVIVDLDVSVVKPM